MHILGSENYQYTPCVKFTFGKFDRLVAISLMSVKLAVQRYRIRTNLIAHSDLIIYSTAPWNNILHQVAIYDTKLPARIHT